MVSQTSRFLQFHSVCITQIVVNNLSILYLTTKASDVLPMGSQVKSLDLVGRGNKRSKVRTPSLSKSEKSLSTENTVE